MVPGLGVALFNLWLYCRTGRQWLLERNAYNDGGLLSG